MSDPLTPTSTDHTSHDRLLIAGLVDRSPDALTPDERRHALAQVASCTECRSLLADLRALSSALPTTSTPPRPRDFSLTPADADRLRPRGLRWMLGLIGTPRDSFTRPLALGLTTLGIVGLLVASLPGALGGFASSAGGAPVLSAVGNAIGEAAGSAAPAPAAAPAASAAPSTANDRQSDALSAGPVKGQASAAASGATRGAGYPALSVAPRSPEDTNLVYGADNGTPETGGVAEQVPASDGGAGAPSGVGSDLAGTAETTGPSPLVIVAGAMFIAGIGLLLARWSARHFGNR